MSLPSHLFDPAFRHQKLGLFFSIIVGIMVYVATFAMAAETSLSALTFTWGQGMERHLTIEVPAVTDESSTPQAERIKQIMSVLHATPGIVMALPLPDDDTLRLLSPWINQPDLLKSLPIPALIDVERAPDSRFDAADLQNTLKSIVRDIHVDDHASWMANLTHLIHGLAVMAALTILLTGITLVIAVSLICRAIMTTERDTVYLLHNIGAEDKDIASHFQHQARRLSWPASIIGFVLAIASAGLLLFFLHNFMDPIALPLTHWLGLGTLTLLVPVTAIYVASLSARMSILQLLHDMS